MPVGQPIRIIKFAGDRLSGGTLQAQEHFEPETPEEIFDCEGIMRGNESVNIFPVTFENQDYYQGQCAFRDTWRTIGAITVSLS